MNLTQSQNSYRFEESRGMKIPLTREDEGCLCSPDLIREILSPKLTLDDPLALSTDSDDEILAFDIYYNEEIIAFAMLRKTHPDTDEWFLWNYAVAPKHRRKGHGYRILSELFVLMRNTYGAKTIVTSYIHGNSAAEKLYFRLGFKKTDTISGDGVHEINMIYTISEDS